MCNSEQGNFNYTKLAFRWVFGVHYSTILIALMRINHEQVFMKFLLRLI